MGACNHKPEIMTSISVVGNFPRASSVKLASKPKELLGRKADMDFLMSSTSLCVRVVERLVGKLPVASASQSSKVIS